MFVRTQATPNPETLKFMPGTTVSPSGAADYRDASAAQGSPLALRLFSVRGVERVFLGEDFIAVTKSVAEWEPLRTEILEAILDHYDSGAPAIVETSSSSSVDEDAAEDFDPADAETVESIKAILDQRVRPAVAQDGGDILFRGYRDGVVSLHMRGACAGCPSSTATLKHGIENLLRHFLPEVREVRQTSPT